MLNSCTVFSEISFQQYLQDKLYYILFLLILLFRIYLFFKIFYCYCNICRQSRDKKNFNLKYTVFRKFSTFVNLFLKKLYYIRSRDKLFWTIYLIEICYFNSNFDKKRILAIYMQLLILLKSVSVITIKSFLQSCI